MRICRLVWNYPRPEKISYGLGPNFYHISSEQAKQGIDVHILALKEDGAREYEEKDGVKIHRVGLPYNLRAMEKLMDLHRDHRFDLIHAHGTCGIFYPLFKPLIRRPLLVHTHGTTLEMVRHKFRPSPKHSLVDYSRSLMKEYISIIRQGVYWKQANRLIAVSKAAKDEIQKLLHVNPSKIEVVYNGVDPEIFKRVNGGEYLKTKLGLEGKRVILYVGHFGFRKGMLYLFQAMQQVLKEVPDAALLCVGGTPKWLGTNLYWTTLQESILKYGLTGKIILNGQVSHHKLPQYYSIADVFAFPSLYEALGKVIIEASACEIPVVASRVGGIPEIIRHGENGFLIEPKNIKILADYIIQILQDKELAQSMGRRGRQTVLEKFTWAKTVADISKAYVTLTKQ
jgi:glycosyltransferase involved in cell wall biosynthesis